jgi:Uma2 family endonuclease
MSAASASPTAIPPLETGDRLTQAEFHRRYELHPDLHHVELIEGVVYLPSPIRIERHGEPQGMIIGWLATYVADHPDVRLSGPGTVILDGDNEPEPDAMLFLTPEAGGQARLNAKDYVVGAPELVVEISASSVSVDLGDKMRAYRRNGVREYIVWSTFDEQLRWFALRDGDFELLEPGDDGIIRSTVFEGLRLDVEALLKGDLAAVLQEQSTAR